MRAYKYLLLKRVIAMFCFCFAQWCFVGVPASYSYGPPSFFPDGPHPRIWLTPDRLAMIVNNAVQNKPDWVELLAWCKRWRNHEKGLSNPSKGVMGNWASGYRGSGWSEYIINFSLASLVLEKIGNKQLADDYAEHALRLADVMIHSMSVGEEENGLAILRMTDALDRTINLDEATALKEQNETIGFIGHKEGYSVRFVTFAVALAYDWLHGRLSSARKDRYQRFMFRTIDWIFGKRSSYNNGVLWKGVRYFEDTDGPCLGKTDLGELISCTKQQRSRMNPHQFAFAYDNPGDNYWSGYFLGSMLSSIATYGDNPDAAGYFEFVKKTLWEGLLKKAWSDPLQLMGGDSSEGWNYGGGYFRDFLALRALCSATGENVFADITFPREVVDAYMHLTSSNLKDIFPTGDWGNTNRGRLNIQHIYTPLSILHDFSLADYKPGKYFIDNAKFFKTTSSVMMFEKLIFPLDNVPNGDLSGLPLFYHSVGTGTVTMRNSWDNLTDSVNAAFLIKKQIDAFSHDNYDAGHFYIQRGDDVLFSDTFGQRSNFHSIITFAGEGQLATLDNGSGRPGVSVLEDFPGFLYFKGDMTKAYVRDSSVYWGKKTVRQICSLFSRSVVYIRPSTWLVYDTVQSGPDAKNYSKQWHVQFVVDNPERFNINPEGQSIVSCMGGSCAEFWALFPKKVDFSLDTTLAVKSIYRVGIQPATVSKTDHFLNAIGVGPMSNDVKRSFELIQSDDSMFLGAVVKRAGECFIVFFGSDDSGGDTLKSRIFDINFHYASHSGPLHVLISDLPSNTQFTVLPAKKAGDGFIQSVKLGNYHGDGRLLTTSAGGLLYFDIN